MLRVICLNVQLAKESILDYVLRLSSWRKEHMIPVITGPNRCLKSTKIKSVEKFPKLWASMPKFLHLDEQLSKQNKEQNVDKQRKIITYLNIKLKWAKKNKKKSTNMMVNIYWVTRTATQNTVK